MLTDTTAAQCLAALRCGEVDYNREVCVQGTVTRRRRHEAATFLMVQLGEVQVQVVLSAPTAALNDGAGPSPALHLLPAGLGSTVWCIGHPGCDREGSLSLYARELKLLKVHADSKQISNVLDALADGLAPGCEVATALCCTDERLAELVRLRADVAEAATYRKELRQQALIVQAGDEVLARELQAAPSTRQRKARVTKSELQALEKAESLAAPAPPIECWEESSEDFHHVLGESEPMLDVAPDLPSARGPQTRGEYFHGRKWPQVRWILRRLSALRAQGQVFRHILDVGGGRGDLAINMAAHLGVKVTVVDMNASSLKAGQSAAERAGVDVTFLCMDFRDVYKQACGGLSDAALGFAACRQIAFLVCPCCHLKHTALEPADGWASLCPEVGLILRQLAERDRCSVARRALEAIAALRLRSLERLGTSIQLKLATFPETYSMRNIILIGELPLKVQGE
ncbi:hda-6 [Symbiodinium sp. CCMP2456]|nr:hda-6 [Symbiodinium sp. CCMP2456]